MRSPPSWPAAHSMDTTWFAVDADGNVAVFDTGEDGALPEAAASGGGTAEPSFDTFFFYAARLGADLRALGEPAASPPPSRAVRVVLVLAEPQSVDGPATHRTTATPAPIEGTFPTIPWRVVREADPRVLASEANVDVATQGALARRPDVLHLVGEDELYELLLEDDAVFHYHHDDSDGYAPGQYRRASEAPTKPLALSDLSASDREEVGRLVLPVHFAEAEKIHLADFMADAECHTWGEVSLRGEPKGEAKPAKPAKPETPAAKSAAPRAVAFAMLVVILALAWWWSSR